MMDLYQCIMSKLRHFGPKRISLNSILFGDLQHSGAGGDVICNVIMMTNNVMM